MTSNPPECRTAIDDAVIALRTLVRADACNYQRDTMRYCGLFHAGRVALAALDGEPVATPADVPVAGNDPLLQALRAIAAVQPAVLTHADCRDTIERMQQIARRALDTTTW